MNINDFEVGDRLAVAPHTDTWMRGDRYATVVKINTRLVKVHFEQSGKARTVHPSTFSHVVRPPCRECGVESRYTIEGISLCSQHRGLLSKFRPIETKGS